MNRMARKSGKQEKQGQEPEGRGKEFRLTRKNGLEGTAENRNTEESKDIPHDKKVF